VPQSQDPKPRRPILTALRNNFIAGLVVIAPIGLTLWLIWTVVGWVDSFVWPFVPSAYQPEELLNRVLGRMPLDDNWIEVNVRGIGVVIFLVFTMLVGRLGREHRLKVNGVAFAKIIEMSLKKAIRRRLPRSL